MKKIRKNNRENIKQDKKIEPGSYKGRKSSEPENNRRTLMDLKMLEDKDRIFQNLYNDFGSDLKSAKERGDWSNTKEICLKVEIG